MTIVISSKGNYAAAESKKFIYECGRTIGIVQYDQESSLKALCTRVCASWDCAFAQLLKGIHKRKEMQRTFYRQLRALLCQIEENAGIEVSSDFLRFLGSLVLPIRMAESSSELL